MIIDAYTHGFHGQHADKLCDLGGDWIKQTMEKCKNRYQKEKPHICDVALRVEQLERNGIDLQMVNPFHELDCNNLAGDADAKLAYAKALNNCMAQFMDDSKGKLIAGGSVPMEGFEKGGRQEMRRAIHELGLKAIMIVSNVRGKPIDAPEFEAFWAGAAEEGVPVYIHPSNSAGAKDRSYEAEYDLMHNFGWPFETELMMSRLVFSGVMERYPTLKVVTHHLGGGIPFFWGRIDETYCPANQPKFIGRVLPEPLFAYFSRFYYDTAVGGSAAAIRCAYDVFGADQLVFATDAPFGPGTGEVRLAEYPKAIKSLGLPEADTNKILAGNARSLLNV